MSTEDKGWTYTAQDKVYLVEQLTDEMLIEEGTPEE